jgi:hypothetical protein
MSQGLARPLMLISATKSLECKRGTAVLAVVLNQGWDGFSDEVWGSFQTPCDRSPLYIANTFPQLFLF